MPSRHPPGDPGLARRLERALEGEVRFDAFTRGLYATDASHYQVEPIGVVFPKSIEDVEAVFEIARNDGVPVLPRGAGTSQGGQTIGRAVVIDTSRWLTAIGDVTDRHVDVEPGVVLDQLNARLRSAGLWFPVDPSTSSRATLGGMAGNNSAGTRSLRYGMMVDNVSAAEILLVDGRRLWVGNGTFDTTGLSNEVTALRELHEREADEIARRTPRTLRNVAGYNLDRLRPDRENFAQLLVGSEGTLAFFSRLRLKLAAIPARRVVGVCHFTGLLPALDSVQHLVALEPSAVELVDRTVLGLALARPDYRAVLQRFVRGSPGALLLVEFSAEAGDEALSRRLDELAALLAELGHPDSVVRVEDRAAQAELWNVRQGGLSIVMSMAGPRRPVSFIEDCAVPLEHLAEYAQRVDEIFARHGVTGTWYAHASVGCLHVRPALNLKDPDDVARVRSIAEAVHAVVRELGGTHSGEHGDGIVRSEFLRTMLGDRMVAAYEEVKRTFDPTGLLNPGRIVDPPRMDDRSLFRYAPGYAARPLPVVLDWSATGGLLGAVERCDNNGACRKLELEVMCPSFRVTGDERHSTRGRANGLRLALTGQLDVQSADGTSGLDSPEMTEALSLCISCKACKRECPTGVDMARIKLEWLHRQNRLHGVPIRERMLAELPRVAARAGRLSSLLNFGAPFTRALGIAKQRSLPRWARHPWRDEELTPRKDPDLVLFVDTFTRWLEPENARAARRVLERGGWTATSATPPRGQRPLCCGRTYLSAGMLDEARVEARRTVAALAEHARAGRPIVGLEPSCLHTLQDEVVSLVPGDDARAVAERAVLLEELVERGLASGRALPFAPAAATERVLVHGHCHQKAHGGARFTLDVLRRVPGLDVKPIESSCCGMAGPFGYHAEHYDVSMRMGELSLFPAVRASPDATIVADGTSCRAQIADGTGRQAVHAAVVLEKVTRRAV
jgi:FAD/FMN-containing dehydrogenase/Fe-S oxidoreductase